ncbi:MAG: nucleotide exchange factor GrpE [Patescibacteria group bacterium]
MEEQNNKNFQELSEKLNLAEQERDEYLNGWKRAKADLINAKKDWEEKISSLGDFITIDVVRKLLPALDALEAGGEADGLAEIKKLFSDMFGKIGVEEIDARGKNFDPMYHESVGEGEGNSGEVVEVLQKGYLFKSQIIRPARVKIGKHDANIQMNTNETN